MRHLWLLTLLVVGAGALRQLPATGALRRAQSHTSPAHCWPRHAAHVTMLSGDDGEEEPESLYNSPADFEFDAVTVTALLGAALAFQFFVLANL